MNAVSRRAFLFGLGAVAAAPAAIAAAKGPAPESKPRVYRARDRHAVFVSILPADHMVERVDDQPIWFDGPACVLDCHLSLKTATRRAQAFNRQQLNNGIPGREWAFVMAICKPQRPTEGGPGA